MIWPQLVHGIRSGLRSLRAEPTQSAVMVAVLSLGIGTSLAIFATIDLTLIRPLPYRDGDRLVVVHMQDRRASQVIEFTSYPVFDTWKQHASSLVGSTAFLLSDATMTGSDRPELVQTAQVESDFFPLLGTSPQLGRCLEPSDMTPGNDAVVVLSHSLWISRYGGADDVLSKDMWLDGRRHTIVGVMPQSFEFPTADVDLWRPLIVNAGMRAAPLAFWASVAVRLAPTTTPEAAEAELSALVAGLAERHDGLGRYDVLVRKLRAVRVGDTKQAFLLLQAAVVSLLLIACANVASLLVLQGERRRHELATRFALGATRTQVVSQLLAEASVLAVISGGVGLVVSQAATRVLYVVAPPQIRAWGMPTLDWRVVAAGVAMSAATLLFFGLLPALRASRPDLYGLVRGNPVAGLASGAGAKRTRHVLVACECALAVVLLASAGLLARTLWNLRAGDPGFARDGVLTAAVRISPASHRDRQQLLHATDRLLAALSEVPGVTAVGATRLILTNEYQTLSRIIPQVSPALRADETLEASVDPVSPDYFRVMHVPLVQGRGLTPSDGPDTTPVALVNESLARRTWPGTNPVGQRLAIGKVGPTPRWLTVVGVVGDMRRAGLEKPAGHQVFVALRQTPSYGVTVALRTRPDPHALAGAMREAVWRADQDSAVWDVMSVAELLDESVTVRRFQAIVLAAFAGAALLLAIVGVSALAYRAVTTRGNELGVRLALGATPSSLVWLVAWDSARPALVGIVIGVAAALAVVRLFSSVLFGVVAWDVPTLGTVAGGMAVAAIVACLRAAWRAARINPSDALRSL